MTENLHPERRTALLAAAAIAAQLVFVAGWVVGGLLEGHGYSSAEHDISDLGALTAHHAWIMQLTQLIAGVVTILFAIVVLRRWFGGAAWLVALSLLGLDNLSDAFFRLDCRAADAGCSNSDMLASWHAQVHLASFLVAALATVVAPFVLASRMKRLDGWGDLARPARIFGVLFLGALVLSGVTTGTSVQGLTQRVAAVLVCAGFTVIAARVLLLSSGLRVSLLQLAGR
jgi:hypothetical protein